MQVLTAEEKVEELNRIVDKQRQDLHRMSLEVEDLAADKVSMERLLRQNVSRYVAQEMEEKDSSAGCADCGREECECAKWLFVRKPIVGTITHARSLKVLPAL